MNEEIFRFYIKEFIINYYKEKFNKELSVNDIYIVWQVRVLKNNKALASTNVEDGFYFEITYNGDKEEFYFDSYKKIDNTVYKYEHL